MTALRNARPAGPGAPGDGRDPAEGQWSQLEVLVAALVDETRLARWEAVMARLPKGGKKPEPPEPIPRPGVGPRKQQRAKRPLPPEVADWLFRMQNGGGGAPIGDVTPGEGVLGGVHQRRVGLDRRSPERQELRPEDPAGGTA